MPPIDLYLHILKTLVYDEIFQLRCLRKEGRILLEQYKIFKKFLKQLEAINFDNLFDTICEHNDELNHQKSHARNF
jgi:hypothetical protein